MEKMPKFLVFTVVIVIVALAFISRFYVSVPAGHVAVATLFGKVRENPFEEGLHIPVNPLYDWHLYDVRQKTHLEVANVPSQDQLQTKVEVSVQFRLIRQDTPHILSLEHRMSRLISIQHHGPQVAQLLSNQ